MRHGGKRCATPVPCPALPYSTPPLPYCIPQHGHFKRTFASPLPCHKHIDIYTILMRRASSCSAPVSMYVHAPTPAKRRPRQMKHHAKSNLCRSLASLPPLGISFIRCSGTPAGESVSGSASRPNACITYKVVWQAPACPTETLAHLCKSLGLNEMVEREGREHSTVSVHFRLHEKGSATYTVQLHNLFWVSFMVCRKYQYRHVKGTRFHPPAM